MAALQVTGVSGALIRQPLARQRPAWPSFRRPHERAVKVFAGDKKDAQKKMKQTQEAVKGAVAAIESSLSSEASEVTAALNSLSQASQRLGDKEEQLWQRQEAVYQREMQRWAEERLSWTAREALLMQQVSELQSALVQLASQNSYKAAPVASPIADPPTAASAAAETISTFSSGPAVSATAPTATEQPPLGRNDTSLAEQVQLGADLAGGLTAGAPESTSGSSSETMPTPGDAGPPPKLANGADDIFWVNQLHIGLAQHGLSVADDETEDWFFGDSTENALLTFQACSNLKENGLTTKDTWRKLLGDSLPNAHLLDLQPQATAAAPSTNGVASPADPWASSPSITAGPSATAAPAAELAQSFNGNPLSDAHEDLPFRGITEWPLLRDGDGGRDVHHLHVALQQKGYRCHPDDEQWWQFSDSTFSVVQGFQACSSLPQTGIVDEDTWKALLGPSAEPSNVDMLFSNDESDIDMIGNNKGVWLLGEQRWSRKAGTY